MNPIFVSDNINKLKSNTTKFCGHCKLEKNKEEFNKNKSEIDGLQTICKVCVKEYYQKNKENKKEYYQKNKENKKEYNKKYYEENKEKAKEYSKMYRIENKEKAKESSKKYYQKNKEKNKEHKKEYYQKNKENKKEYYQMYRIENKEKVKEYFKKYYEENKENKKEYYQMPQGVFRAILNSAKKRNLECNMTKEEFIDWYKNQERKCHYCKRSEEETCKEIVNGRKYGRLSIDRKDNTRGYSLNNIVLACFRCNGIKSNYYTEQEMLQFGATVNKIEADRKTLEDEFNLKKENKIKTELQKLGVL